MLSQKFPFSYVTNMLTPRNMFAGRTAYSWWQLLVIVIFLNALILMPVSFHYAGMETYQIDRIVDNGLAAVTEKTYPALRGGSIQEGRFSGVSQLIETEEAVIAVLPDAKTQEALAQSQKYGIVLTTDKWYFYYPNGSVIESFLSGQYNLSQLTSRNAVLDFLNQQWYNSHRAEVFVFVMLVYAALLYLGSALVVIAGGVTLYLTRKAGIFDLKTFKGCVGLLANCLGLPSLLAVLANLTGLVENPIMVMNTQVFGSILMLMVVLYRTGFRDKQLRK
ncbi:maltodextrose utilization protein malA [Streptococcus sp. S784/96/1]|uniref:maltodextrose utilization protein malA n=1 Tax=Streptococcus sp. S784/96/1 TaxID=2653499 RepID=UPI001386F04A|nr:maltodextrose utilization protein malA [Streptococcus sp. S784/96/1]